MAQYSATCLPLGGHSVRRVARMSTLIFVFSPSNSKNSIYARGIGHACTKGHIGNFMRVGRYNDPVSHAIGV